MKIIAIETAYEACSVALRIDNEIKQRLVVEPRMHAKLVLSMLRELLDEAGLSIKQLDGVAYGRGPGSFTGLRIAASVAQGLALSHQLPAYGVSSLHALADLAFDTHQSTNIAVAMDARMKEVYFATFDYSKPKTPLVGTEQVIAAGEISHLTMPTYLAVGNGFEVYKNEFLPLIMAQFERQDPLLFPTAKKVASLALSYPVQSAEQVCPVYLRNQVTN